MEACALELSEGRDEYLTRFSPLVKRMAGQLLARLPPSVESDDIVQAGLIGLMDAISRFEEGQGVRFEAYAAQRIRGAMLDELRASDWLPRSVRRSQRGIEKAVAELEQQLQRTPTASEVAARLGVSLSDYREMLHDARCYQLLYFEDFLESDDSTQEGFLDRHCVDDQSNPMLALQDRHLREALADAIGSLPQRERRLMSLYYEQQLNFREIAAELGVTESRVCQLRTQAIGRLRTKMKDW